jgi:peptidoglycan/LPS O-acetylase OafA/YrhL
MRAKITTHIDFLDSIRGTAILLVVVLHGTNGWVFSAAPSHWQIFEKTDWIWQFIVSHGAYGVAIFFVVSGFCIHLSFQKLKSWPIFFVKRFFRIYPPYLVAVLFFAFLFPFCNLAWVKDESATKVFLQHVFMLNNYRDGLPMVLNPSFWSVATEVQLYILYPVVVSLSSRFGWDMTIMVLGALEIGLRLFETVNGHLFGFSMSPFKFWFSWAIGAYICQSYLEGRKCFFSNQSVILWVVLCILATFFRPLNLFGFTLAAVTTAVFISKKLEGKVELNNSDNNCNIISKIGVYSYGIYLLHQPFFWFSQYLEVQTTPRLNARLEAWFSISISAQFITLFWCIFICVILYFLCALFYRLVERPSMRLGHLIIKIFEKR